MASVERKVVGMNIELATRSENETGPEEVSKGESGQTLVEYALILSFVAAALVASLIIFQTALQGAYSDITAEVESWVS